MSSIYIEVCSKKGVRPLREVVEALESDLSEIKISPLTQTSDIDLLPVASLLSENLKFLKELELTGQLLTPHGVSYLAAGLQENKFLLKLSLSNNNLNSVESITTLCLALNSNSVLEFLDLSENEIQDSSAEALKELLRINTSLKIVNLDKNLIEKTAFAVSLCENDSLKHFSISYNPLTFDNLMSLLEMLNINTTLLTLSMKGVKTEGTANIKENSSGVLNKEEALILKLANVLRNSHIQSLAIDLNPRADLQLRELENSLLKHNTTLINLSSDVINWKTPQQGALLGIQKALRANLCLIQDSDVPSEVGSIVDAKKGMSRESRTLKNFAVNEWRSDSHFSSPVVTSPDMKNSQYLNESREGRIAKFDKKREEVLNWKQMIEDLNSRMQNFEEEITGKLQNLQGKVEQLSLKTSSDEEMAARVSELEKKDEANQKMLMLISRELSEIKAKSEEKSNSQTLMKVMNLDKKVTESSRLFRKMQKQVEDVEIKLLKLQCLGKDEESEKKSKGSRQSKDTSFKISELAEESSRVDTSPIPGATEQLVMKAIQEKSYWSNRKKENSRGASPISPAPHTFYSPEKCPSKDLHERLVQKGMNFVPRSGSSSKKSPY